MITFTVLLLLSIGIRKLFSWLFRLFMPAPAQTTQQVMLHHMIERAELARANPRRLLAQDLVTGRDTVLPNVRLVQQFRPVDPGLN